MVRQPTRRLAAARGGQTVLAAIIAVGAVLLASGCSSSFAIGSSGSAGQVVAVGAENEYADVIQQVGGKYVHASAIMSNPNTDPHTFEASASVGRLVGGAQLVVQNGVGYDTFMNALENATPSSSRKVIVVQNLLGLPDSTPNPHLWYKPGTMPAVANAIAADLAAIQPAHASYFKASPRTPPTSRPARPPSSPRSPRGTTPSPRSRRSTRTRQWPPLSRWPITCCRRPTRTT